MKGQPTTYNTMNRVLLLLLLGLTSCLWKSSSDTKITYPENLKIISTTEEYKNQVESNPDMELVNLEMIIPGIALDIRYAGTNNFTGEKIYDAAKAYARRPVANSLKQVQDSLATLGYSLLVYDAYRPYAASVRFFEVYPDTNFVANPKYGSRHNRGCAVDVSLVNMADNKEVEMPSAFDDFSERAHPDYNQISDLAMAHRELLFGVMKAFGFTHYHSEWWHFDYQGWEKYPLMDLSFKELER